MTKAKISEYDAVAANNTDVNGVNIDEGCAPSGMNNMGREIMAALKRFETGADGDSLTVGGNLIVSGTVTAANTATLGNVDVNGGTIDGAVIGGASAAAGSFTTLNTSGQVVFNDAGADVDFRVEGDTDANLLFVDASTDRVGVGTNTPSSLFDVDGLLTITNARGSASFSFNSLPNNTATDVFDLSTAVSTGGCAIINIARADGNFLGKAIVLVNCSNDNTFTADFIGIQPVSSYFSAVTVNGSQLRLTTNIGASINIVGRVFAINL
jgi:hypothetical protein